MGIPGPMDRHGTELAQDHLGRKPRAASPGLPRLVVVKASASFSVRPSRANELAVGSAHKYIAQEVGGTSTLALPGVQRDLHKAQDLIGRMPWLGAGLPSRWSPSRRNLSATSLGNSCPFCQEHQRHKQW